MGAKNSTTLSNWVENNVDITSAINLKTTAKANDTIIDTQKNSLVLNAYTPSCCDNVKGSAAEYSTCLKAVAASANQAHGVCGGSINITQTIGSKDLQTAKADATMTANIVNSINTALDQKIDDIVKQNNTGGILGSLLKLGDTNDSNVSTHIKSSIKTTITENLTTSAINNIRNISGQNNNTAINICFGELASKDCNLSQDATFNVYQNNLAGSVANITATNKDANTIYNGIKNSDNQANDSLLGKLLGDLSKTEKIIFAIIIVVAVVTLLLALIWMAKGHSDSGEGGGVPNLMREGGYGEGRFREFSGLAEKYGAGAAEVAA